MCVCVGCMLRITLNHVLWDILKLEHALVVKVFHIVKSTVHISVCLILLQMSMQTHI